MASGWSIAVSLDTINISFGTPVVYTVTSPTGVQHTARTQVPMEHENDQAGVMRVILNDIAERLGKGSIPIAVQAGIAWSFTGF